MGHSLGPDICFAREYALEKVGQHLGKVHSFIDHFLRREVDEYTGRMRSHDDQLQALEGRTAARRDCGRRLVQVLQRYRAELFLDILLRGRLDEHCDAQLRMHTQEVEVEMQVRSEVTPAGQTLLIGERRKTRHAPRGMPTRCADLVLGILASMPIE